MTKKYFKRNYVDVMEIITPSFYLDEDLAASGVEVDPLLQIINGHMQAANDIATVLNISSLNTLEDIAPYFVKQNRLTKIDAQTFQSAILDSLSIKLGTYESSGAFKTYVEDTLLPSITLNSPTAFTNQYLIDNLSWVYFLNTSGTNFDPSSDLGTLIASRLFSDQEISIADGVGLFTKHLWYNYNSYIPQSFASGTSTYTSGTQGLDNIITLVNLIYNDNYADLEDVLVRDSFQDYIDSSTLLTDTTSKGAFFRFLRAIATAISDTNDSVEDLEAIYNIEKCPAYQLPLIANLIGWKFFGEDVASRRLQLRNAVGVYKRKGTKAGIQLAIDSILPSNTFEVSSILQTLYESYVPYLIQYALVTDSSSFNSLETWTKELAVKTDVNYYSYTNLEENIQHVVDKILLDTYTEFPKNFIFNNKSFDPTDTFAYRGKIFSIPPYTDEKFYVDCQVTEELISYLEAKMRCFGVSEGFATQVGDYIRSNTFLNSDRISIDGGFMFHTSSYQSPPNYSEVIASLSTKDINSLGLWNSRSSHFNIFLDASSYDFSSLNLEADTGKAIIELSRAVNDFSPAHSIPVIDLFTDLSDIVTYLEYVCTTIALEQDEFVSYTYGSSAVDMAAAASIFKREEVNDASDVLITSSLGMISPRNAIRRRNQKNILDTETSYDRNGVNQPIALQGSGYSYDALTLGFIPSSLSFALPTDANLSGVYGQCAKITSNKSYFGVDVSNTVPVRGYTDIQVSSCLLHITHGDTDSYISLLHKLHWEILQQRASYIVSSNYEPFFASSIWMNHIDNEAEVLASSVLANVEDFEFGSNLHRLYKDYTTLYGKGNLSNYYSKYLDGGKDVYSHTYGQLFYNGTFDIAGSATAYHTTSLSNIVAIDSNEGSGLLSYSGAGTYTASDVSSIFVDTYEHRNPYVISGIELVLTSGTSNNNVFEYITLPKDTEKGYMYNNTFITSKAINGLPRIRFDLATYVDNFLTPEHEFKISNNFTILDTENKLIGGGSIGVWIHTKEVAGKTWTWTPDMEWVMADASSITKAYVLNNSHIKNLDVSKPTSVLSNCIGTVDSTTSKKLSILTETDFSKFDIIFNTKNAPISVPEAYYKVEEQIHSSSQNYIVEIFNVPSVNNVNKLFVLESTKVTDTTNESRASIKNNFTIDLSALDASNIPYVSGTASIETTLGLTPERLSIIFKHFNNIAVDLASRVIADTSSVMLASGGSRINYRVSPEWVSVSAKTANTQYTSLDISEQ